MICGLCGEAFVVEESGQVYCKGCEKQLQEDELERIRMRTKEERQPKYTGRKV